MPFDVSVIRDGATYSLTAGTPYKLLSAEGLAGPAVTRATLRAPAQDGDVDYGYHLEPRLITLAVGFAATSGSALDGYRDTFMEVFRPERSVSFSNPTGDPRFQAHTPLTLQVTRDDGEVRRIDCYATGPADMPLVREHRPGNLQRGVVQLVAPNPTWYGTAIYAYEFPPSVSGTVIATGTIAYQGDYYADARISCAPSTSGTVYLHNLTSGGRLGLRYATNGFVVDTARASSVASTGTALALTNFDYDRLRLMPSPIASGGTNVYMVSAQFLLGTPNAILRIGYFDRYLSY